MRSILILTCLLSSISVFAKRIQGNLHENGNKHICTMNNNTNSRMSVKSVIFVGENNKGHRNQKWYSVKSTVSSGESISLEKWIFPITRADYCYFNVK